MILSLDTPIRFQRDVGAFSPEINRLYCTYDPATDGRGSEHVVMHKVNLPETDVVHFVVNGISYAFGGDTEVYTAEGPKQARALRSQDTVGYLFGYGQYGDLDTEEIDVATVGSEYTGDADPEWLHGRGIGAKLIFLRNVSIPGTRYTPFLSSIAASYGIRLVNLEGMAYMAPKEPYEGLYAGGMLPDPRLVMLPIHDLRQDLQDGLFWRSMVKSDDFYLAEGLLVR